MVAGVKAGTQDLSYAQGSAFLRAVKGLADSGNSEGKRRFHRVNALIQEFDQTVLGKALALHRNTFVPLKRDL